jgi:hypothetical protein
MQRYVADGWHLGGAAIRFVLQNRPLKRFLLGSLSGATFVAGGVAAAGVVLRRHAGPVEYVVVGALVTYCLNLIAVAVEVGAAAIAAGSLERRQMEPADGWSAMRLRRKSIAGWALVDATVGLPSRAVGSWSIEQLSGLLLGFGWGVLSFFAIPTIAFTGAGPLETARHSWRLVRARWGDAVSSTVYLWVRAAVVFGVPSAAATAVGVLLIRGGHDFLGALFFVPGAAGLVLTYLLTQVARTVLTVVLYRFAETGMTYAAFPVQLLERGLRGPSKLSRKVADKVEGERLRGLRRRLLGELERR